MSSECQVRLEHATQNEQTFQSYNARRAAIEESGETPDDEPVPFVCGCDAFGGFFTHFVGRAQEGIAVSTKRSLP